MLFLEIKLKSEGNAMIKKEDFTNVIEMPEENQKFILKRKLTETEINNLKNGYSPQEMDDKWFLYCENNKLFFHRSWTGFCIYIVSIENENGELEVIVNRNSEQYLGTDIEKDKIILNGLINTFGQITTF